MTHKLEGMNLAPALCKASVVALVFNPNTEKAEIEVSLGHLAS